MTRPRPVWIGVAVLLAVVAVVSVVSWWENRPLAPRTFETRQGAAGREVLVKGQWLPLVENTTSALVGRVPPALDPGQVVHLNADGTACLTSHVEAARRNEWEIRGWRGYPKSSSSRDQP